MAAPNKTIIDADPNSFPRNVTLDEFVFAKFQEAIGETSEVGMRTILEAAITQSYLALILDEDDRAERFMHMARKAHERYNSKVTARANQIDMPPLDQIQIEVLKRMLDPKDGLPDDMAAHLATKLGVPLPPRVNVSAPAPAPASAPVSTNAPAATP